MLERIGCLNEVRALSPAEIAGARFYAPSGRMAEFELGSPALGLGRMALDEALFLHARHSGALAVEGASVTSLNEGVGGALLEIEETLPDGSRAKRFLRAERVVAAYGRRNALDRPLRRSFLGKRSPLVGYKLRHVFRDGADAVSTRLRGKVEIHLFNGGYCGVSEVDGGAVNVCLLAEDRVLAAAGTALQRDAGAALSLLSPSLRRRVESLRPEGEPLAVAQVTLATKETGKGSVLFVGDAAGMIAPLCGDGQAMALESAVLLSELMLQGDDVSLPARWNEGWHRRFDGRLRVGRWLQSLLSRPRAAEGAVRLLQAWPRLASSLLSATRGAKLVVATGFEPV